MLQREDKKLYFFFKFKVLFNIISVKKLLVSVKLYLRNRVNLC